MKLSVQLTYLQAAYDKPRFHPNSLEAAIGREALEKVL